MSECDSGHSASDPALTARTSGQDAVMDDFLPSFPARIVIRTKPPASPGYVEAQRLPQSRLRGSISWMGHGNSRNTLRTSPGSSNVVGSWGGESSVSSGSCPAASIVAEMVNEQVVQPTGGRSPLKRSAAVLTEEEPSLLSRIRIGSSSHPTTAPRSVRILSEEWRDSPSLARPAVVEQNLASLLLQRELPGVFRRTPVTRRNLCTIVTPNTTFLDVQHPTLFLRKFSPDGRFLVAYSGDLQVVHIFRYRGVGAVGQFFRQDAGNSDYLNQHVVSRDIFKNVLREEFRVRLVPNDYLPHNISRDFSLFTEDSQFVIVVTSGPSDLVDDTVPEVRRTNESLPLCSRNPLDDYKFSLISLAKGEISDQLEFKVDKIAIHHCAGVYLQGNILWILSSQHQLIQEFQIIQGKFVSQRVLGQYCFTDTGTTLAQYRTIFPHVLPADEVFMGTLRQKLFMELFRIAKRDAQTSNSYGLIMEFHRHYTFYKRLKIWKFQLLDGDKMLIKWAPEEVVTGKASDPASFPQFFTFFDLVNYRFYGVYDYRNAEMLRIFEKFHGDFRNPPAQHPDFQCDSYYSTVAYNRLKRISMTAKNNGGLHDSCSRLLAMLPIPCQSFTPSPYVDMSLFQYDTSLMSNSERMKSRADEPIRFYSRDTGTLNYVLHVAKVPGHRRSKRVVTHIFHPYDPLIITCEKQNTAAVDADVHFHVWKCP